MDTETQLTSTPGVGSLIAEVESKMSELMAWHKQQVSQFEEDKARFDAEMQTQREALKAQGEQQRKTLAERMDQLEQQRVKLAGLANKLRAEESAMSREWGEVQRERESLQKQAAEIAKIREQAQQRAKAWLDTTATELSEPLKLITDLTDELDEEANQQAARHQEAA